jgi:hypothetical protein
MEIIYSIILYLSVFISFTLISSIKKFRYGIWWFASFLIVSFLYLAFVDLGLFCFAKYLGILIKTLFGAIFITFSIVLAFYTQYPRAPKTVNLAFSAIFSVVCALIFISSRPAYLNYLLQTNIMQRFFPSNSPLPTLVIPSSYAVNALLIFLASLGLSLSIYTIVQYFRQKNLFVKHQLICAVSSLIFSIIVALFV